MKTLQKIICVAAGVLALSFSGCATINNSGFDRSKYVFNGKIDGEEIKFEHKEISKNNFDNILTIKKADGEELYFEDNCNDDLYPDFIQFSKSPKPREMYSINEYGKVKFLKSYFFDPKNFKDLDSEKEKQARKDIFSQFNYYLKKIVDFKKSQSQKNL